MRMILGSLSGYVCHAGVTLLPRCTACHLRTEAVRTIHCAPCAITPRDSDRSFKDCFTSFRPVSLPAHSPERRNSTSCPRFITHLPQGVKHLFQTPDNPAARSKPYLPPPGPGRTPVPHLQPAATTVCFPDAKLITLLAFPAPHAKQ